VGIGNNNEGQKLFLKDIWTKSYALGGRERALKVSREGVLNARERRREGDYQSRCKHGGGRGKGGNTLC